MKAWWLSMPPVERVIWIGGSILVAFLCSVAVLQQVERHDACIEALKDAHVGDAVRVFLCR